MGWIEASSHPEQRAAAFERSTTYAVGEKVKVADGNQAADGRRHDRLRMPRGDGRRWQSFAVESRSRIRKSNGSPGELPSGESTSNSTDNPQLLPSRDTQRYPWSQLYAVVFDLRWYVLSQVVRGMAG